jgi:hypothetical protein
LKVAYHCLSEPEHVWHYICQQLVASCAEVDECTHTIIHVEDAIEQQVLELEERAAVLFSPE